MLFIRARIAPRPAAILSVTASRTGCLTSSPARPLIIPICLDVEPAQAKLAASLHGPAETSRKFPAIAAPPCSPSTLKQIAALGAPVAAAAAPSSVPAQLIKFRKGVVSPKRLIAAVVVAAHGVCVTFPVPKTCSRVRVIPPSRKPSPTASLKFPVSPIYASGGVTLLMAASQPSPTP